MDELEGQELGWSEQSSAVDAVVAIAGPADLSSTCSDLTSPKSLEAQLLGTPVGSAPERARLASPAVHAASRRQLPPFLLLHGDRDEEVPFQQSELLLCTLLSNGSKADLLCIPGGTHLKFGERSSGGKPEAMEAALESWTEALERSVPYFFDCHVAKRDVSALA